MSLLYSEFKRIFALMILMLMTLIERENQLD